ncbi:MAG: RNA polymerase sigma factor [Myxococcota bacterium]
MAERRSSEPEIREADRFDQLFRTHERQVAGRCRRILGAEAGRDAVQEVFLRARRSFDSYQPDRPFAAWLLTVASHHCIDQLRRTSRETRLFEARDLDPGDLLEPGPTPLRHALLAERRDQLLEAVESLPLKYRLPLVLRYFEELDYDAIADTLDVTRGQVGTLLFRAKRRLRARLAEDSS